jgi:hypothetical protein
MGHPEIVAGADDRIPFLITRIGGFRHGAPDVDAPNTGKAADHLAHAGGGQRILVIDAGERGLDQHLAGIQLANAHFYKPRARLAVFVVEPIGFELFHGRSGQGKLSRQAWCCRSGIKALGGVGKKQN